jgi:hypothetical protein
MTRADRNALWIGVGAHALMLVCFVAFQIWLMAGWCVFWGAWSWTQLRRASATAALRGKG